MTFSAWWSYAGHKEVVIGVAEQYERVADVDVVDERSVVVMGLGDEVVNSDVAARLVEGVVTIELVDDIGPEELDGALNVGPVVGDVGDALVELMTLETTMDVLEETADGLVEELKGLRKVDGGLLDCC